MKSNKIKFFFVASALVSGFASAALAEDFNWGGDPNSEIGAPGSGVADNALNDTCYCNPEFPHSPCCLKHSPERLNGTFSPLGASSKNGSKASGAKD